MTAENHNMCQLQFFRGFRNLPKERPSTSAEHKLGFRRFKGWGLAVLRLEVGLRAGPSQVNSQVVAVLGFPTSAGWTRQRFLAIYETSFKHIARPSSRHARDVVVVLWRIDVDRCQGKSARPDGVFE